MKSSHIYQSISVIFLIYYFSIKLKTNAFNDNFIWIRNNYFVVHLTFL
jgi:hypothetical protein